MIKYAVIFSLICSTFAFSAFAAGDDISAGGADSKVLPNTQDVETVNACFGKIATINKALTLGETNPKRRNEALTEIQNCMADVVSRTKELPTKIAKAIQENNKRQDNLNKVMPLHAKAREVMNSQSSTLTDKCNAYNNFASAVNNINAPVYPLDGNKGSLVDTLDPLKKNIEAQNLFGKKDPKFKTCNLTQVK